MDWLDQFNQHLQGLTLQDALTNLGMTLLLSVLLSWHYLHYSSSLGNKRQYAQLIIFLATTTMMVISVVKSSVTLSLGLVGALSIIRFRTPIKEPEDLAYIFLALAVGIGIGADQSAFTAVIFAGILLFLSIYNKFKGTYRRQLYLHIQTRVDSQQASDTFTRLQDLVQESFGSGDLRRMDHHGETLNVTLVLNLKSKENLNTGLQALNKAFPEAHTSVVEGQTFD